MRACASTPPRRPGSIWRAARIDIWPLYLFHDRAQTINAAISLRAHCTLDVAARRSRRACVGRHRRAGRGRRPGGARHRPAAARRPPRPALRRARRWTCARASDSPVGAGIAGSSAHEHRAHRRAGGLDRPHASATRRCSTIAMNVEAQVIGVPTGVQDYRPALYGGVSAVELGVDRRRAACALAVDPRRARAPARARLHGRVAQLRHQQLGRHDAAHQRRRRRHRRLRRHPRRGASAMRDALERQDWDGVGRRHWRPNGTHRKRLAPGVTTRRDRRAARARAIRGRAGRQGLRRRRRRLPVLSGRPGPAGRRSRAALAAGGAAVLPFRDRSSGRQIGRLTP